jgi:hypothetical protein
MKREIRDEMEARIKAGETFAFKRTALGKFKKENEAERVFNDPNYLKFALIRDPTARYLSAWKNKVTCEHERYKTDTINRDGYVGELIRFHNHKSHFHRNTVKFEAKNVTDCLSLEDFLEILDNLWKVDMQMGVNVHFQPQYLQCFHTIGIERFQYVIKGPITPTNETHRLVLNDIRQRYYRYSNRNVTESNFTAISLTPEGRKVSGIVKDFKMTDREEELMRRVTARDYEYLGPYL